ncbi:MAG: tRNA pseudouridine(38-40) synthase TruA [bacterium]|jgi:tRNA pseudouridine38-40 synthase
MAHYQFIVAYDGTDFKGSQRQGIKRTVQLVLEDALREIGWNERTILLAGRTDSGVHAIGQVASCNLEWKHSETTLVKALNARLPGDLAVRSVRLVDDTFHARYSASARTYNYRIYVSPSQNPLAERYAWRVWPEPNLAVLAQAANLFIGDHDFQAFGSAPKKGGSTVRQVTLSRWDQVDGGLQYAVSANGFLYHMVRRIVLAQIQHASGIIPLETLRNAIENGITISAGMAPAKGLVLTEVSYGDLLPAS